MIKEKTGQWIDIMQEKPKEGQSCWYWFEVFKKVYAGKYSKVDETPLIGDMFYDPKGYLTDDVTWWMPKEDGDDEKPVPPSDALRSKCHYHPLELEEGEDDDEWMGMVRKSGRCDRVAGKIKRKKPLER